MTTISAGLHEELEFEQYRRELTGYCYRMLGSGFEAEDAVQETMVRAWRNLDTFEGRAALRSWLYKIATNVCVDMLRSAQRRARPMDLGPAVSADGPIAPPTEHSLWVQPIHDERVAPDGDPAEVAEYRESIKLALIAALQHLPPRQRAVLILREVLKWQAAEVAELLEASVASVNSALQRARATLDGLALDDASPVEADLDRQLLGRYVEAFERYDIDSLVAMLHDEVRFSMPPYPMWLNTPEDVSKWMLGPGIACKGSRILTTTANGGPAVGQYRLAEPGVWEPWALQVIRFSDGVITEIHNFLDRDLFPAFGLPRRLVS